MSVFRYFIPENAILQQIDASIERLLADFRWQSIDFVDALKRRFLPPFLSLFQGVGASGQARPGKSIATDKASSTAPA